MEREESFQKVHPLHTLEGKHSELWHDIFVWCFDMDTTPLDLEHTLFFYVTIKSYASVHNGDTLLLKMDMLVVVITLVNFSCIPEGSRESRGLG